MKREVIIHLGHGKTGSSSIQKFLKQSPKFLFKRGYIYPTSPTDKPNIGNFDGFNHDWLEKSILPIIQASGNNKFIFSSEIAFNRTSTFFDVVHKYMSEFSFKLVIFARDPIPTISSTFLQRLKKYGECPDFSAFLSERMYVLGSLKKLSYIINRAQSTCVDLEIFNFSSCNNVVKHFLHRSLGFDSNELLTIPDHDQLKSNLSISYETALLLLTSSPLFNPGRFHKINKILQQYPEIYYSGRGVEIFPSESDLDLLIQSNKSHMKAINKFLLSRDIQPLTWESSTNKHIIDSKDLAIIQNLMKSLAIH